MNKISENLLGLLSRAALGQGGSKSSRPGAVNGFAFLLGFLLLMRPSAVFALQLHGHPEGLYAHQLGHIFFIFSMAVFAYWLQKTRLSKNSGWRFVQVSCAIFILWNLGALVGHMMESSLAEDAIVGVSSARALVVEKVTAPYLLYFLKMDHLFAVPAMILFLLGVNRLRKPSKDAM